MEINQKQQYQPGQEQQDAVFTPDNGANKISGDIPVVRTNTPRPLSFASMLSHISQEQENQSGGSFQLPRFPSIAPSAPPLPEELAEDDGEALGEGIPSIALTSPDKTIMDSRGHEFIWLFEYGLEMDFDLLNSAERLNGAALLYGAAVLKGYALMLGSVEGKDKKEGRGQTVATIVADATTGTEVWGVLYRIPWRVSEHVEGKPSLLDTVHLAGMPRSLFSEMQIVVHDPYRKREIACVAYAASESARQQIAFVPVEQVADTQFVQRLAELARKYKLPDKYLSMYSPRQAALAQVDNGSIAAIAVKHRLDTDPLPVLKEKSKASSLANILPETPLAAVAPQPVAVPEEAVPSGLLMAFAIYLIITLLGGLAFAVVQGLGLVLPALNANFAPLDVPWLVMFYGLLGGCISCIVMLVRYRAVKLPHFVIISWFTRPYIGAMLAALAYLMLNSGIFALKAAAGQQEALSLLAGAIAGLCEGWIFFRWK